MSWLEDLSAAWKNEYADLDTTVLAPMTRLARLSVLIDTFQQEIVAPFGVSTGEYAVLAALRRNTPDSIVERSGEFCCKAEQRDH